MESAPPPEPSLEEIPDFLESIFYPKALESLRDTMPSGTVKVIVHRGREQEEELILNNLFPFMTLQDVKLALYVALKKDDAALPEFVHLSTHGSEPGKTYIGKKTMPFDYTWKLPAALSKAPFFNAQPFDLASGAVPLDGRFVDSNGERRLVEPIYRERATLEDIFMKNGRLLIPEIHAYFYKDLEALIPGGKPVSELNWNGRLYPFFPFLSVNSSTPTADQRERTARLTTIFLRRQQFLVKLERVLYERFEMGQQFIPMTLAGVRLLRLTWPKQKDIPGIESLFYEAPVTPKRPFMRFIPTEGSSISKVYLKEGGVPDIQEPSFLVGWAQEMNPTPDRDFAFAKILVRKALVNMPPVYSTLRLFDDGSADVIIEPPKGIKKLEPLADLSTYGADLVEGLKPFPHLLEKPDIGNATVVLGVRLKKGESPILGPRILKERLPIFSAFFQEILPLPGEKPLAMLRYKLISNFDSEDRIDAFITQVISRKVLKGEVELPTIVEIVADEFQIDLELARKRVANKIQKMGEVAVVNPETKDYKLQYNPGIDIAIFAQHPFYTFHLYRVDSLENFQRVVTALSLLINIPSEELQVSTGAVRDLLRAERAEALEETAKEVAEESIKEALVETTELPKLEEEAPPEPIEEEEDLGNADDMPDYMDYFLVREGENVAENEAAAEAAVVEQKEGSPIPEAPLPSVENPKPLYPTGAPAQTLRKELEEDLVAPRKELEGAVRPAAVQEDEEDISSTTGGIANFFIRKLKEADRRLFDYKSTHPSLKGYVSSCQPTYGRQPAVVNEEKFQEMREEYEKDGVVFQVFPLEPGEPDKPSSTAMVEKDYYTVLRYGTSAQKQNYYLCSRFFCTRDEMIVREQDLMSDRMRRPIQRKDGTLDYGKLPGECPFCRGKVIKNKKYPQPNETIIERPIIPKTKDDRMLYIRFLKKTTHPDGFYLPCCHQEEKPVRLRDNPAFDKYKEWGIAPKPRGLVATTQVDEEEIESEEEEEFAGGPPRTDAGYPIVDYWVILATVAKRYIVGAEKLPLEIGTLASQFRSEPQIGVLPLALNPYFDQDPTNLVSRSFNPQKLKEGANGFLRVAVDNRLVHQNDSLLAALAPYYYLNTAAQMKEHILNLVTPRVFLALNYGNLALEFYDPAAAAEKRPMDSELATWASEELQVDLQQENKEALVRAYLSYITFEAWLRSTETKKEFRHFALLLAQSKLLRREERRTAPGITFIVLDILKSGKVSVRCPPYGFNAELNSRNDVAFLMHHWSGVWEPLFYVDNRDEEERRRVSLSTLIFKRSEFAGWPEIVTRRFQEYIAQCSSSGRSVYTSQSKINPMAMIPASLARRIFQKEGRVIIHGVIRDAYNHLVAFLLRERLAEGVGPIIPFPVIDDGDLIFSPALALDWSDPSIEKAPVDLLVRFYRKYVEPNFRIYPGYKAQRVAVGPTGAVEAVQLRNGLYVPAGPASNEEDGAKLLESKVEIQEMEWSLNHEIALEDKEISIPGEEERIELNEFNEIFEHLRITFSNWLATKEGVSELRKVLLDTIFSRRLPLFEKRKRLEILLARQIERWITTDFQDEDAAALAEAAEQQKEMSLLRTDCRIKTKDSCKKADRCVWKQGEDRCLLHVPEEIPQGGEGKRVSAPRVLLLRLIEELLRFGERRRQLLEGDVSRLASFEKPVVLPVPGNPTAKQIVYPEKSMAWFDLLRLEWAKKREEEPKYLEEFSREVEPAAALPAETDRTRLPELLFKYLGGPEDPKVGGLRLLRAPFPDLFTPLGISPKQIGVDETTEQLSTEIIDKIVEATARTVVQIDIRTDEALQAPRRRKPWGSKSFFPTVPVFIVTEEGPALLVEDPEVPNFLSLEAMPAVLKQLVETAKGKIMIKKPAAAPAAAKP